MKLDPNDRDFWDEKMLASGWPECGNSVITIEELYQVFKARLIEELKERKPE